MGSKERRERERIDLRNRILDAARELFASSGIEAVTMRAIAEKIDYTPTAIYYHFADKESLILELCHEDMRSLTRALSAVDQVPDPLERLRLLGMAYAEFGLGNPNLYRFLFMTRKQPIEQLLDDKGNPEVDGYALLVRTVTEAIEGGRLRPELNDVQLVAQLVWGGVHGVVSLHLAKEEDKWVEWRNPMETAAVMIDVVMRGISRE